MSNYDDYDPNVHRSRIAKKESERANTLDEELRIAKERQQEYARRSKERQNSEYSTNSRIDQSARQNKQTITELFKQKKEEKTKNESKASEYVSTHAKEESLTSVAKNSVKSVAAKTGIAEKTDSNDGKKKYKINIWQLVKFLLCILVVIALLVAGYCYSIVKNAPEIDTSDINSLLTQSSTLYDDQGQLIDNVFGDKNRTIVEISDIPQQTQNAFIALEDKTFRTHHGFNIIRIFGAIKDAMFNGGHISGTSTITQQLARNLYMESIMSERSIKRKLIEAYYAIQLEKNLTKDQILEAYLNCVNFGDVYGIQTAAQKYFSKDVQDLTLAESAWLACIPQYPSAYKLIKTDTSSAVTEETENLITTSGATAYLWNDAGKDRKNICLRFMMEYGYISEDEYQEAKAVELKDIINPSFETTDSGETNYFADYVITQVISDLQSEYGYDADTAHYMVYNQGLEIYTTLDTTAQTVLETEFENDDNFPKPISYTKDINGNILKADGGVLLYDYANYIEEDGAFKLSSSEYLWNKDGSLTILSGKRLAIYNTTVQGTTDYSVEFRPMYEIVDGVFYSIPGGYLNIPQQYKSRDANNNLVLSSQFFVDYPNFFSEEGEKLTTIDYSLKQRVIQPQAAMTIIDNKTGAIKAMIGGRKTSGRMLYNRATATRQPGSSIKPLAVYSAALQKSFELSTEGKTFTYTETGYDQQGTSGWGDYITAASIVEDEPMTVNGEIWPKNSYKGYRGIYTFRQALQQSVNVCAVKILCQVGVDYAFDMAESYGLTTLIKEGEANDLNVASLGLGGLTNGVSTLEMASAYTTFVNEGIHKGYSCYTQVLSRSGGLLLEPTVTETKVLDSGVAYVMRNVLQSVVSEGIASAAAIAGEKVGGKTGTTSDSYDIWFDGFTANYSAALWIGNDVNIKLSSMSNKAAALWSKVMKQIPSAKGGTYSAKPDNVVTATIDTKTGLLATEDSEHKRKEYFTKGTEPIESGTLYKTVKICSESGYLATPSCPDTYEKTGTFRDYVPNEDVKDYDKELTHYYCNLHNPDSSAYPVKEGLDITYVPEIVHDGSSDRVFDSHSLDDYILDEEIDLSKYPDAPDPDSEEFDDWLAEHQGNY